MAITDRFELGAAPVADSFSGPIFNLAGHAPILASDSRIVATPSCPRSSLLLFLTRMEAPRRYQGHRQQRFAQRWRTVLRKIGPPPTPPEDYAPVLGYTRKDGFAYVSAWRRLPCKAK